MNQRLQGKVVLITGAAQGQGRAHAALLAREGADIIAIDVCRQDEVVNYRMGTAEGLADTAQLVKACDRRVVTKIADVRDRGRLAAAVDDAVAELGRLDAVVANAGICTAQSWDEVTPEVWSATLDTNLTGVWHTCQATIPHLMAGGGSIVLISSAAGQRGLPFLLPYVVSKHGVVGMMRSLANELGLLNIRVNAILPGGGVQTPMSQGTHVNIAPLIDRRPDLAGVFGVALPVDWLQPEDISPTVAYLVSDDSRHVTGVVLPVDAGHLNH
jgi:SDR family mycofactocin-dependent oxidoreductase